ncbi:MAG: TolC family protein [Calditrichaceae bacterium]|nr:TolC family protein [Calditrichaceae bacterium]MBN2709491.1 TolC family protein [Calditrichaceae bacterium]RQV95961.1 MAG: TolC family protein [Calditrichota bacterium]
MLNQSGIMKIVFFLVLSLGLTGTLTAQADSTYLSLDDCIVLALEKNTDLKSAEYTYETADVNVKSSYSGILPVVSASASKGKYIEGASEVIGPIQVDDSLGNAITVIGTDRRPKYEQDYNSAGISINQNLFDGGIWWNRIRQAKTDRQSSEYYLMNERNRTILTTKEAFYDLNKQIQLLVANQAAVQRSQGQLERTEKMFELGATARLDVYRAKVNLGNDRITMLNQKNIVESARKKLNIIMGRDPLTPLEIQSVPQVKEELPPIEEITENTEEINPTLKRYEEDIHSRDLTVSMAKGVYYPELSASFNYSRSNPDMDRVYSSQLNEDYSARYGLSLSINLFNGFRDYVNVQKAKISKKNTEEQYENYRRNLKANIVQNYNDYYSMLDIIKINEQNLEAAREEMRLSEERYQIGAGTSLDVRESQVNLSRAEQTLIAAQYNALLLYAQLQYQIGASYENFTENK